MESLQKGLKLDLRMHCLTIDHEFAIERQLTPWPMEPGGSMPNSQGLSSNLYFDPTLPSSSHWHLFL